MQSKKLHAECNTTKTPRSPANLTFPEIGLRTDGGYENGEEAMRSPKYRRQTAAGRCVASPARPRKAAGVRESCILPMMVRGRSGETQARPMPKPQLLS